MPNAAARMRNGLTTLLACATLFAPSKGAPQNNAATTHDPLDAFAGTWVATNPNETAPYMILRLEKRDGKLIGSVNPFHFGVVGAGRLVGSEQSPGEIPLSDLRIDGGEMSFRWRGSPPFEGSQTKFVVEGTKVAELVFSLSGNAIARIIAENPRASGMNPVVWLTRVSESILNQLTRGGGMPPQPNLSGNWEVLGLARLINTAEVQYKLARGQYADYPTLLRSGQLEETGGREFTGLPGNLRRGRAAAESDPLPGYSFRLTLSEDKNAYRLVMREKSTTKCQDDVMTDETGIVKQACNAGEPRRD